MQRVFSVTFATGIVALVCGFGAGCAHDRAAVNSGSTDRPLDGATSSQTMPVAAPTTRRAAMESLDVSIAVSQKAGWTFTYPNGKASPELHLPADLPAGCGYHLTSADVIHAMFIPDFRVKVDAIPGRPAEGRFPPHMAMGAHDLLCAEFCGPRHSQCRAKVVVESDADFERWLNEK